MIVEREDIHKYLGNDDSRLASAVKSGTLSKLVDFRNEHAEGITSITDYVFRLHQEEGMSLMELGRNIGVDGVTIRKLFSVYNLPFLSRAEATRKMLQDRWQDPEFRKRNAEGVRKMLQDRWQDPEFRKRQAGATRKMLQDRWQDPEFRKRNAEGVRKRLQDRWQDPEFRKRQAGAIRNARHDPKNEGKFYVRSFNGFRRDLGLETYSAWEANLGRAITHTGREMIHQEPLRLEVSDKFKDLFESDVVETSVDYMTLDPRGNFVAYEIRVSPYDSETDMAKLEMIREQYGIKVIPVTDKFYNRIQKRFKDRINEDDRFSGWEEKGDNIKTHPEKYGVKQ